MRLGLTQHSSRNANHQITPSPPQGGFARVYLATEPDGKLKALKVVAKEQLKSTKNKSKVSKPQRLAASNPSPT